MTYYRFECLIVLERIVHLISYIEQMSIVCVLVLCPVTITVNYAFSTEAASVRLPHYSRPTHRMFSVALNNAHFGSVGRTGILN